MAEQALLAPDVGAALNLLNDLIDKEGMKIDRAFWAREEQEWRLIIVSPGVDEDGPLAMYHLLVHALDTARLRDQLNFSLISVVSPNTVDISMLSYLGGLPASRNDDRFRIVMTPDFVVYSPK